MTAYDPRELEAGWEFKILRSSTETFKRPERMREILEEEARAGWVLVEKFDNQRVRLKRPASARERDPALDFDPYRTTVPGEAARLTVILVGIGVALALVVFALVFFLK